MTYFTYEPFTLIRKRLKKKSSKNCRRMLQNTVELVRGICPNEIIPPVSWHALITACFYTETHDPHYKGLYIQCLLAHCAHLYSAATKARNKNKKKQNCDTPPYIFPAKSSLESNRTERCDTHHELQDPM